MRQPWIRNQGGGWSRLPLGPLLAGLLLAWLPAVGPAIGAPPTRTVGTVESTGLLTCWAPKNSLGAACETSAAILIGPDRLLLAHDKTVTDPKHSPLWSTRLPKAGGATPRLREYMAPLFRNTRKIEGMAITPDRVRCFATSAYLRPDPAGELILTWRTGAPEKVKRMVYLRDGKVTDFSAAMAKAIDPDEPPAGVKIEGLAWLPGARLAFGIRSIRTSKGSRSVGLVLTVAYRIQAGRAELFGPLRKALAWDPGRLTKETEVGISSLAYDAQTGKLVIVTTYEHNPPKAANLGAFCWLIPVAKLGRGTPPRLVRNASGKPLRLGHKAESIVPLGGSRYLLIDDDDRVLGTEVDPPAGAWPRKANQAAYAYLRLR